MWQLGFTGHKKLPNDVNINIIRCRWTISPAANCKTISYCLDEEIGRDDIFIERLL